MKLVCLPCEVQHREFDSKLLLAARLANTKDCAVLIGFDKYFSSILSNIPGCFLLDKSMSTLMLESRIKPCKNKDGIVFVNDEEGVNDLDETPAALDVRADSSAVKFIDKYLAWGEDDLLFFGERKQGLKEKTSIVGSHRYDLLNKIGKDVYAQEVQSLRMIFGDFILYNDNLAVDHYDPHYKPPTHLYSSKEGQFRKASDEWARVTKEHIARRDRVRDCLLNLSRFGINIVVRPHPVYDPLFWHESFRLIHNIQTIYKGPVEPWIHASKAVITTGCTTGLQALLADKPSFELPVTESSKAFSSNILPKFSSPSDLNASSLSLVQKSLPHLRKQLSKRWFHSNSTTELMAELITDSIHCLPSRTDFSWLSCIQRQQPTVPKWRELLTHQVQSRLHAFTNILQLNPSLRCKKVTTGLYIVFCN